jgi:hypothetical protein
MSQWSHRSIDTHVPPVLAHGGGDKALLMSLVDHMGTCKSLMEMSTGEDMNVLGQLLRRRRGLNLRRRRHALRRR